MLLFIPVAAASPYLGLSWTHTVETERGSPFGTDAAAGDFDGDGLGDLLVANPNDPDQSWIFRGASGGPSAVPVEVERLTAPLAIGDFDGDGREDIAASQPPGRFFHAGTTTGFATGLPLVGNGEFWPVGDVDGDGSSELLFLPSASTNMQLLGATAAGPEVLWSTNVFLPDYSEIDAGHADLDGDGLEDIWVSIRDVWSDEGALVVAFGESAGLGAIQPVYTGSLVATTSTGDPDGDGFDALQIYQANGNILQFDGSATGLQPGVPTTEWVESRFGDIDGDGLDETVLSSFDLHLGTPTGIASVPAGHLKAFAVEMYSGGDADGDGLDDVYVANRFAGNRGYIGLFKHSTSGLETLGNLIHDDGPTWSGWYASWTGTAGDVNGDGKLDVVRGGIESGTRASVHLGTQDGIEQTASTVLTGDPGFGYAAIGVGDVDGDGFGELVVHGPNGLEQFPGSPSGPLATPTWTGTVAADVGRTLTTGDVNGDGRIDLVAAGRRDAPGTGGLAVFLGGPTGFASTPDFERPGQNGLGAAVSVGDVDGDGFDDLLVGIPDGAIGRARIFRGTATGPETSPAFEVTGDRGLGAHVAMLDADADGFDDVVVATDAIDPASHRIEVYPGGPGGPSTTPTTVFEVPSSYTNQDVPRSVLVRAGDADGDGFEDLVVRSGDPRFGVHLLRGATDGLEAQPSWSASILWSSGASAAAVGDINADGRADLILGDHESMWLLYGDPAGFTGDVPTDPLPPVPPPEPTDTGSPTDTAAPSETGGSTSDEPQPAVEDIQQCGCDQTGPAAGWLGLLGILGVLSRRP